MFSLDISASTGKAHVGYLRAHLLRARKMLKTPLGELSLALVGDRRMAELHERFMNIPGPTDVLTFELDHDGKGRVVAGEVVVCVPFAARQAKRTRVPIRKELLLYAIHGMLHLCGFDDRNDADFAQMHQREDEILKRLGVGPVFAAGRSKHLQDGDNTRPRPLKRRSASESGSRRHFPGQRKRLRSGGAR